MRYKVVENSRIGATLSLVLDIPYNEEIVREGYYHHDYNLVKGTPLARGLWYRTCTHFDLDDNQSGSSNKISFDYHYETKDGEVNSGSMTLPVL